MDTSGEWAPGVREEVEAVVRATVKRIGYEQDGFHWETFRFENNLHANRPTSRRAWTRARTRTKARATRASCSALPATRRPT
jgi:S-adenosylmethionine synthetase